jgi:hypothetical protein
LLCVSGFTVQRLDPGDLRFHGQYPVLWFIFWQHCYAATHNQNSLLIFIVRYAYVVFGMVSAVIINAWLNRAQD